MSKKGAEKPEEPYMKILKDADLTLFDVPNKDFKNISKQDQIMELAFSFSTTGEIPKKQVTNFIEYLIGEKISGIRDEINTKVKNLIDFKRDSSKKIDDESKIIAQEISQIVGKNVLNKQQYNLFEQFVFVLGDETRKIYETKGKIKQKDLALELQKSSIEKVVQGIEIGFDYWVKVFQEDSIMDNVSKAINIQANVAKIRSSSNSEKKLNEIKKLFTKLQSTSKGTEFLKVITAAIKANQMEFADLETKTEGFQNSLINGSQDLYFYPEESDDDEKVWKKVKKIVRTRNDQKVAMDDFDIRQSTRAKDLFSRITKLLHKPTYDPQQAIQDGIGLRIEAEKKEHVITLIQDFFRKENSEEKITEGPLYKIAPRCLLRTRKLLSNEFANVDTFTDLQKKRSTRFIIDPSYKADFFEDVRILGKTKDRENFEIQFVLVGNKNESGLSHHGIWDQVRIAKAKARIGGHVTEESLKKFAKQAYLDSTDEDKIKDEIKKELIDQGKKNVKKPHINQRFKDWKKERKAGIMQRLKENAIEFETGKYIYVNPKERFKYRLIEKGILSEEHENVIIDEGLKKWIDDNMFRGKIDLYDLEDSSQIVPYEIGEGKKLPEALEKDLRKRWLRENRKDKKILNVCEDYYKTKIILREALDFQLEETEKVELKESDKSTKKLKLKSKNKFKSKPKAKSQAKNPDTEKPKTKKTETKSSPKKKKNGKKKKNKKKPNGK